MNPDDTSPRSFRLLGYGWSDLPALFVALVLSLALLTGFSVALASALSFLTTGVQKLLLGLSIGYLIAIKIRQPAPSVPQKPAPPPSERVRAIAQDPKRKIEAIKLYREETGAGLKEAKEAVEACVRDQPDPPGEN